MNTKKIKPSRWFYLLAVAVIIGVFAVQIKIAANNSKNSKIVDVPGSAQVTLNSAGYYEINYYKDSSSGSDEIITNTSKYDGLKFTLQDSNDKNVSLMENNKTKNWKSLSFNLNKPGTYTLKAEYDGQKGPSAKMIIFLLRTPLSEALTWVFRVILLASVIMIITVFVMRKRNKSLKAE